MTKIKANKNKREFWYEHITLCQSSNLSQIEYCRKENLNFNTFTYWRGQYLHLKTNKPLKQNKILFLPAKIKQTQTDENVSSAISNAITIVLPNHIKLILPSNLPQHEMLSCFRMLGELP